jgi:hypothetical protein
VTTPTPDGPHLDLDAIADLEEGLTDPATAAEQQAHLDGCADCRAARARLVATREALAGLPAEPMPAGVVTRVDAAVAAAGGTIVPATLGRSRVWTRHPSLAGLAAAAAVAAVVGAVAVGALHGSGSDGTPAGADTAGGVNHPALPQPPAVVVTSGRVYTPVNAGHLVNGLDAAASTPSGGAGVRSAAPSPAAVPLALRSMFVDPAALANCVAQLTGVVGVTPVAVDYARYSDPQHRPPLRNVPALVVVLRGIGVAGKNAAYIVGPHCATAPDNNIYRYEEVTR